MDVTQILVRLTIVALPILLAITLHEAAHAFAADRFGDDTAKRQGRMTLNPIAHVDPFGTVILPLILFILPSPILIGYAKPVPVRFDRLNNPKRDMIWVAAAGPGINLVLALVSALLLALVANLPSPATNWAANVLSFSIFFNVLIALFNLIPILPLDGGRILTGLLPRDLAIRYSRSERFGFLLVLGLFLLVPMLTGWSPFVPLILEPTLALSGLLHGLAGIAPP